MASARGDRPELFRAGALHWPEGGVVLRAQHSRERPIVRTAPDLRGAALWFDVALPDTSAGRDAATNIREGLVHGPLSVEFRSEKEHRAAGVRIIERAALTGAGLVDDAAYAGSTVEVRHRGSVAAYGRALRWLL